VALLFHPHSPCNPSIQNQPIRDVAGVQAEGPYKFTWHEGPFHGSAERWETVIVPPHPLALMFGGSSGATTGIQKHEILKHPKDTHPGVGLTDPPSEADDASISYWMNNTDLKGFINLASWVSFKRPGWYQVSATASFSADLLNVCCESGHVRVRVDVTAGRSGLPLGTVVHIVPGPFAQVTGNGTTIRAIADKVGPKSDSGEINFFLGIGEERKDALLVVLSTTYGLGAPMGKGHTYTESTKVTIDAECGD